VGAPECEAAGAVLTVVGALADAEGTGGTTVAFGELEAMR
jgi:hypothetical protein